jgi:hypothetical protein
MAATMATKDKAVSPIDGHERRLKSDCPHYEGSRSPIKAKLEVAAFHQVAEFWTLAAHVNTNLHAACESLNDVQFAA